jgi:hypothetical protein
MQESGKDHKKSGWLSSNWPISLGWLCLGLISILTGHPQLAAGHIGVAAGYAFDAAMAKTEPSKTRMYLVRACAGAVLMATLLTGISAAAK